MTLVAIREKSIYASAKLSKSARAAQNRKGKEMVKEYNEQ